jgi:hypothetical protein
MTEPGCCVEQNPGKGVNLASCVQEPFISRLLLSCGKGARLEAPDAARRKILHSVFAE